MTNTGQRSLRPWLMWLVAALVISGFALSLERFAIAGLNPMALFVAGIFVVGFSSIDELGRLKLRGISLYAAAIAIGVAFVGLLLAIVTITNLVF